MIKSRSYIQMARSTVFVLVAFFIWFMGKRGGVKARVGFDEGAIQADTSVSTSSASGRKGGIRQRMETGSSLDSNDSARINLRGGLNKRVSATLETTSSSSDAYNHQAPMNKSMRRDWAKGKLPANKVLDYAGGAASQGALGCGGSGVPSDPKNAARNLQRMVGYSENCPEISWIDLSASGFHHPHPVLNPISVFEKLIATDERRFRESISCEEGDISQYWQELQDIDHPIWTRNSAILDKSKTVPLGIHGDAAATHKQDGLFTINWNSIVDKGRERFVYAVIPKSALADGTLQKLFDHFAWCLNVLSEGVFSEFDWRGRKCVSHGRSTKTNGFKGAAVQLRGDWEFFTQALKFPSVNSTPRMCWICKATNNPDSVLCWASNGWRGTIVDHVEYLASLDAAGLDTPSLFKIRTLFLEGIALDVLHVLDQGVASHIMGNVCCEIMQQHLGPNQAEQIAALQNDVDTWYSAHPGLTKIQGKLSWARIKTSADWPKLKVKGAATRHLSGWALSLCQRYSTNSLHDKRRTAICHCLDRFYSIIADQPRAMSNDAKIEVATISKILVGLYVNLADEALSNRVRLWKMTGKVHLFQHLCEIQCLFCNPTYSWAYMDEDLQRVMKDITLSVHPSNIPWMVLLKWIVLTFDV